MNYNTVYVGMDVHKESFTLCSMTIEDEKASHYQKTEADYKKVLKYLELLRTIYGGNAKFICGYEAGCLGFTLYHQLTSQHVECIILAPTTMLEQRSKKRIKTDKRDAEIIAKCLAQHNYSPVHIPTATDEQTKEFLRMRDDHKLALKKIKQQILAFCLRHNYRYDGNSHWTAAHLRWLKSLQPEALYKEILDEYLLTYTTLSDKLERLDKRIEELASKDEYKEAVKKLCCFIGVKTHTALSVLVEVGDFNGFASAKNFASYLGLVPGENTSSESQPAWNYQSWQSTCSLIANRGCSKLCSRSDWLQIKRFEIQTIRQFSTSDRLCRQSKRKTKTPILQDGAWSEQETQCSKSSYCKRISMLHVGYDD